MEGHARVAKIPGQDERETEHGQEKNNQDQTMASQPAGYMARPGRGSVCFTGRTAGERPGNMVGWPTDRQALSVGATAVLYFCVIGRGTRNTRREREREKEREKELSATRLRT